MDELTVIGWREWLALPLLGLPAMKAKIDTGARSCSLHVPRLEAYERDGRTWLRFALALRRGGALVRREVRAWDRRRVIDSGGRATERWFIRTQIALAGRCFYAEINLTDRGDMLFPMLLGRSALRGRFRIDPQLSYTCGRMRRKQISGTAA